MATATQTALAVLPPGSPVPVTPPPSALDSSGQCGGSPAPVNLYSRQYSSHEKTLCETLFSRCDFPPGGLAALGLLPSPPPAPPADLRASGSRATTHSISFQVPLNVLTFVDGSGFRRHFSSFCVHSLHLRKSWFDHRCNE